MINIDDVKDIVATVGGYDNDTVEKYLSVISNAVISVEKMLKDSSFCDNSRVVFLAGIKACNDISLAGGSSAGVTSFKVGDISITESGASKGAFGELYRSALDNCRDLLSDNNGFAFINV